MSTNAPNQGDDTLLLELATRLLNRFEPPATDGSEMQSKLLPGIIPSDLRDTIPFPDNIRIVGSHTSQRGTTVIFDTALSKEQLLSFYEDRLLPSGWTKPEPFDFFQRGGFSHSMRDMPWLQVQYFCHGPREPYIVVQAFDQPGKPTDVRLGYMTDRRGSPCDNKQQSRMRMFTEQTSVIPQLTPPPDSLQLPKSSQSSSQDYSAESTAYLRTQLDMAALYPHYSAQLEAAGWQQSDSGGDQSRAWSKYTFQDKEGENWNGFLLITAFPTQWGEYLLYVLARLAEAEANLPDYMKLSGIMWSS